MDRRDDENYRQSALNYSPRAYCKIHPCDVSKDKSEIVAGH